MQWCIQGNAGCGGSVYFAHTGGWRRSYLRFLCFSLGSPAGRYIRWPHFGCGGWILWHLMLVDESGLGRFLFYGIITKEGTASHMHVIGKMRDSTPMSIMWLFIVVWHRKHLRRNMPGHHIQRLLIPILKGGMRRGCLVFPNKVNDGCTSGCVPCYSHPRKYTSAGSLLPLLDVLQRNWLICPSNGSCMRKCRVRTSWIGWSPIATLRRQHGCREWVS